MEDELEEGAQTEKEPTLQEQVEAAIGLNEPEQEQTAEPVAAEGTPTPADTAADPLKAVEAKPATPDIYAPLPEHNPRKTHERFQRLIDGHKELESKVKEYEPLATKAKELEAKVQEHEQGWKVFQDMGFNSEEAVADLQVFSQYRNALASGNFDAAAQVIREQARQLALLSGRKIDVDPLSGYQDLSQRTQAGELDEATAMELARARHLQSIQQQAQQRQQQHTEQMGQQTQAIRSAAMEVDQVVTALMRDPDYARVEPELLKQLDGIKTGYPAHMWAREVKRVYDYEKRVLSHHAQQQQPQVQPLRANGHSGGMPAPKSMGDAVLQSLGLS